MPFQRFILIFYFILWYGNNSGDLKSVTEEVIYTISTKNVVTFDGYFSMDNPSTYSNLVGCLHATMLRKYSYAREEESTDRLSLELIRKIP